MTIHTNEELIDVFLAATNLASLHNKDGGLEHSRTYYKQKADEYRREIIRRMGEQQ